MSFPEPPKPKRAKAAVRANFNLIDLPPPLRAISPLQQEARELLGRCIVHLFSDAAGNTAMARRLELHAGRKVSQQHVSHWLAGRNGMPPWAALALVKVFLEGAHDLRDRLEHLHADGKRMTRIGDAAAFYASSTEFLD